MTQTWQTNEKVLQYLNTHTDWAEPCGNYEYKFMFNGRVYRRYFDNDADVNRCLNELSDLSYMYSEGPDEL